MPGRFTFDVEDILQVLVMKKSTCSWLKGMQVNVGITLESKFQIPTEVWTPLPSYEPEDFDFLSLNLKVLHYVGLWNPHWKHKHRWRYVLYYVYSLLVVVLITVHTLTQVLELYFNWGDFTTFANTAWLANNFGTTAIKHTFFLVQLDRLQDRTMKFRGGVLSTALRWSKGQDDIGRDINRQVRLTSWVYYSLTCGAVSGLIVIALRASSYQLYEKFIGTATNYTEDATMMELPMKAWFPVDIQQPGNYLMTFLFQLAVLAVGPINNVGTDIFIAGLIAHASGELRILKYSFRSLKQKAMQTLHEDTTCRKRTRTVKRTLSNLTTLAPLEDTLPKQNVDTASGADDNGDVFCKADLNEKLYESLVECVRHHQEILLFVSELEEMFSTMMFIQFLSISIRICLLIFHIGMANSKGFVHVMTYFQMLLVSFLQGLLFCWFGNELTWQSESVGRVMYETPWVEGTLRFRRSLMITVIRAQTVLQLTGGKIYVMSLETFQTMVYASFSFFRLLQQFSSS